MKHISYFVSVWVLIGSLLYAQIPNPNFEEWSDGEPINWFTSNIIDVGNPISKTSDGYFSTSALRGEVVKSVFGDTLIPVIISGEFGSGFPIDNRYTDLNLNYKFNSVGGDILVIGLWMYKDDEPIGGGSTVITESSTNYTQASVGIEYINDVIPNNCIIEILAGNDGETNGNLNTYFIIDNLSFGNVTEVKGGNTNIPSSIKLNQNYPNPFNPSTKISFDLPESGYTSLKIYNSIGENITTLVNKELRSGNHSIEWNASGLPSGAYFYTLSSGKNSITKRMLLLK